MSNSYGLKERTLTGLFWRFMERCGARGVEFIVSVIIARILSPDDYGLVALVTVFISISQVFVDSGMANALIQKRNADEIDFSTVFYFNICLCCIVYLCLFLLAPYIGLFFNNDSLTSIVRVLGIIVIISSVKNVQQAYVSKNMLFKRFFFSTIGGTIVAAIVGIIMAYSGFGVWALVAQQLFNAAIDTLILWLTVKWRPIKAFSIYRLQGLFKYGWKLLVSSIIDTLYNNLRQLVIGRVYTSADLAFYNRGRQVPNFVVTNINSSIDSVLLPAMSLKQDDYNSVKNMTRRAIKTSSFIMMPMMIGLAVVARPFTILLLTEKWESSIPFLQVFCLIFALEPIHTANLNAIKALGRSDVFLKLEIIKKSIGLVILLITMRFGVFAIALGMLFYTLVASVINSFPNKNLLGYGYLDQIKDMLPAVIISIFMGMVIYPINTLSVGNLAKLSIQVILGAIIYVVTAYLLKIESFYYIVNIIKRLRGKNENNHI